MTGKKFLLFSFLQWLLLALLKFWFFGYQIVDNQGFQEVIFLGLVAVVIIAFVRRFGIMNFLESIFLMIMWTLGNIFLDLALLSNFTGTKIFSSTEYWGAYVVMVTAIFIFHKKRHVHVRHEMHHAKMQAQKHGHKH